MIPLAIGAGGASLNPKLKVKNMQLPKMDERGQSAAVTIQLTLIISLIVAIIIVYQLGIAGIGPTDNASDPNYDADALAAYNNVVTLAWAGIALMAVAIIILAASVILSVVRGFGGERGV